MDNLVTTPKKQVNIISNIVISSLEPMLQTNNVTKHGSTSHEAGAKSGEATSLEEAEEPVLFKHLCFEFPMPKRKIDFENQTEKKRLKKISDYDDANVKDDDNDVKVFNYMTGTYETVRSRNESFDTCTESQNELDALDNYIIKQEIADLSLLTEESTENTNVSHSSLVDSTSVASFVSNVFRNSNTLNAEENPKSISEKNNSEHCTNSSDSEDLIIVHSSFPEPKKPANKPSTLLHFMINSPNKNHSQTLNGSGAEKQTKSKLMQKIVTCQICSHIADTQSELVKHVFNVHLKNIKFMCLHCELQFEKNDELKRHRDSDECKANKQNKKKSITDVLSPQGSVAKCYDCNGIFYGKEALKSHAFHVHLSSAFRCNLHEMKDVECGRCMYEALLKAIKQNNIDISKETSDIIPINKTHDNDIDTVENNKDNNSECHQDNTIILSDEDTVVYPMEQIEDSKQTTLNNDLTFTNILLRNNNLKNNEIVPETSGNNKFKCFDCRFSSLDEYKFKCHIVKHVGSKFRCMHHFKSEEACLKCRYEKILTDIAVCIRYCKTCGFAAIDSSMLEKHSKEEKGCLKWSNKKLLSEEITCCHCPYVTIRKKFLYYHAVDHVEESFSCLKHQTTPKHKETCLECIYEECLRDAKNNVLDCKKCGFKTTIIEVFDVHQCTDKNDAGKNQCWDCNKFCSSSFEDLRDHAVQHYKSNFVCTEHNSKVDCSKCIYQAAVESLEKNIFVCTKCCFKSLSEATYNQHDCVENTSKVKLQCFLCVYTTDNKNLLRYHCKYHYNETFTCKHHSESKQIACNKCAFSSALSFVKKSLFVCDKCDFTTFNGFRMQLHKNSNCDIIKNESDKMQFICFDCGKSYNLLHVFKQHAIQHMGSKFRCTEHDSTSFSCKKCVYEHIMKNSKSDTFTCRKCGYKTYSWHYLKLHQKDDAACRNFKAKLIAQGKSPELKPKKYDCFDCDFSHERLDFLEKHVLAHPNSQFKCDQHKDLEENCSKCIYTRLISDAPKVAMTCHDCRRHKKFTEKLSFHQHILKEHQDSSFACTIHCSQKLTKSCGKCFYESAVKDVLGDNYISLQCWDCQGQSFSHKATLEKHIEECHLQSEFKCNNHSNNCSKCVYEKLLRSCKAAMSMKKIKPIFQCFDCDFSHAILHQLKQHTRDKHSKTKFSCKKHPSSNNNFENCPECFYGAVTSDHPTKIIRCYECNPQLSIKSIRALKAHIWTAHKMSSFVCVKHASTSVNCGMCWFQQFSEDVTRKSSDLFQCFECNFKSDRLGLFKEHVLFSHSDSVFECKEHRNQTNADLDKCPMCFYFAIVSNCKRKTIN